MVKSNPFNLRAINTLVTLYSPKRNKFESVMRIRKSVRFSSFLFLFGLLGCGIQPAIKQKGYISIDHGISKDSLTQGWINQYSDSLKKEMGVIIGQSQYYFQPVQTRGRVTEKNQSEASLARLCADWTLSGSKEWAKQSNHPEPQFAILNHFGLRKSIDSGQIQRGDIYEVMPFDNEVVLLVLKGSDVSNLFDYIAKLGGTPIAGAELWVNDSAYAKAIINGNRFDSRKSYCIATNDFMLGGGDGFNMLKKAKRITKTGVFLRDMFLEELKKESAANNGLRLRPTLRIHQP